MATPRPFGKWMDWVDGKPVPRYEEPTPVSYIKDILPAALALPYVTKKMRVTNDDGVVSEIYAQGEEELEGLTNAEVIGYRRVISAASGVGHDNLLDARFVYEYTLGKPVVTLNQTVVTRTYSELLAKWAEEEASITPEALAITAIEQEQWEVVEVDNLGNEYVLADALADVQIPTSSSTTEVIWESTSNGPNFWKTAADDPSIADGV